jgi:hypothetical protein
MKYERIRPIQTGWALIPISTKTIENRSRSDLGRRADRIPIGIASRSQKTIPPKSSDAVTGAAFAITWFTLCRFVNERPRSWWTTRRFRNRPYCT